MVSNKTITTIALSKTVYEQLRKLSFTSRKTQSVLVEEALQLLFKTPAKETK